MNSTAQGAVWVNRYEVLDCLGQNAGRQTWLALDQRTGQKVVLKCLLLNKDFQWQDLKLFEREANVLQQLSHPAIPRYLDSFELENSRNKGLVLVQSYIEARSLSQHLASGRRFSETALRQLIDQLLEILIYLQSQSPAVIHRDIKPSNILLGDLLCDSESHHPNDIGQVYLIDFGSIQNLLPAPSGTITVVGTYGYMPPEQFGGRVSPASDLYSLGASIIHLATGSPPAALPHKELRIQFEDLVSLSDDLVRWLQRLTAPSVGQRYESALEAKQALHAGVPHSPLAPSIPEIVATTPSGEIKWRELDDRIIIELIQPPLLKTYKGWILLGQLLISFWARQIKSLLGSLLPLFRSLVVITVNAFIVGSLLLSIIERLQPQVFQIIVEVVSSIKKILSLPGEVWGLSIVFLILSLLLGQKIVKIVSSWNLKTSVLSLAPLSKPSVLRICLTDTELQVDIPFRGTQLFYRNKIWRILCKQNSLFVDVGEARVELCGDPSEIQWLGERLGRVLNLPMEYKR